jgi:hypothetical protein
MLNHWWAFDILLDILKQNRDRPHQLSGQSEPAATSTPSNG